MNLRAKCLSAIKPAVEWWGHQHVPYTHKLISGKHYYSLYPDLEPGLIFLSRIRGELSNVLIPGRYTHAAIFGNVKSNIKYEALREEGTGRQKIEYVIEATSSGVHKTDLISFLTSKDYVVALKPVFVKGVDQGKLMDFAVSCALEQLGKPYDFEFCQSDNNAFFCSELVYYAYDQACKTFGIQNPFILKKTLGDMTVTPSDFYQAKDKFAPVWDSTFIV